MPSCKTIRCCKTIVRQNLDPYVDSQAFTRIVMGTYATNQYSTAAQRAQFEKISVKH
jgi:phospholipid transport system substrate-binding protein